VSDVHRPVNIVLCSYLEAPLVERIASVEGVTVVNRPDLLPVPRFHSDHSAPPRDLTPSQLEEWRDVVASAEVTFDFDWFDPSSMSQRCPQLRWIQATSAGIGAFMQQSGLDKSDVVVTSAAGVHAVPLAEFALAGALYFTKGFPQLALWRREHHWERVTSRQLRGTRALVVGLGGIGREVARTFAAQGIEVWGLGREGRRYEVEGLSRVIARSELDDALATSDVLVLCCPLTRETEGLIGETQLARMSATSIVVNISRGPIIDQIALTRALATRQIGGACLDVFDSEPLAPNDPLWDLDKVIVSPHSASTVASENDDLVTLFLSNLERWRRGEELRNRYDSASGY
jgi:glyoxylate/hydroxypyruvate reductase A